MGIRDYNRHNRKDLISRVQELEGYMDNMVEAGDEAGGLFEMAVKDGITFYIESEDAVPEHQRKK